MFEDIALLIKYLSFPSCYSAKTPGKSNFNEKGFISHPILDYGELTFVLGAWTNWLCSFTVEMLRVMDIIKTQACWSLEADSVFNTKWPVLWHSHSSSKTSVIPVSDNYVWCPLLAFVGTSHECGQNTHANK